jgi:hypothetical protein
MQFEIRVALSLGRFSAMQQALRRASLVPAGFVVESARCEQNRYHRPFLPKFWSLSVVPDRFAARS